jgi:hypothetical protein
VNYMSGICSIQLIILIKILATGVF